jgi:malate dehydrogenase
MSRGEYGVPEGLQFSFPIRSSGDSWQVVEGLELDDFAREKLRITTEELEQERSMVRELIPASA